MRGGGGFVAIHNAFGTEYNWPWYEGLLGNANYYTHGAFQDGEVVVPGGLVHGWSADVGGRSRTSGTTCSPSQRG